MKFTDDMVKDGIIALQLHGNGGRPCKYDTIIPAHWYERDDQGYSIDFRYGKVIKSSTPNIQEGTFVLFRPDWHEHILFDEDKKVLTDVFTDIKYALISESYVIGIAFSKVNQEADDALSILRKEATEYGYNLPDDEEEKEEETK